MNRTRMLVMLAAGVVVVGEYFRPHHYLWKWASSMRVPYCPTTFGCNQRAAMRKGVPNGIGSGMALLEAEEDRYNGIVIKSETLPEDAELFRKAMKNSLQTWKENGKKGVWLKLALSKADLVPVARDLGFQYHHAEGTPSGYLMMTNWLGNESSTLPSPATTHLGVGAFVVYIPDTVLIQAPSKEMLIQEAKILVVKEKLGPAKGRGWKIPTGLVSLGEDVYEAAEREVFEETGVRASFQGVVGIRHAHKVHLGRHGDMFFSCLLLSESCDNISMCPQEIEDAKWLSLREYILLARERWQKGSVWAAIDRLAKRAMHGTYKVMKHQQLPGRNPDDKISLYYSDSSEEQGYDSFYEDDDFDMSSINETDDETDGGK